MGATAVPCREQQGERRLRVADLARPRRRDHPRRTARGCTSMPSSGVALGLAPRSRAQNRWTYSSVKPARRVVAAEELDRVVPVAGLLEQLARGARERVLAVHVEQAGRDLRQHLPHGRAELAHEQDVAGGRERQDRGGAVVRAATS